MLSSVLSTHEISTQVLELITRSINYCFIVTPYFKPWPLLEKAIEKAARNNVGLVFVLRDGEIKRVETYLKQLHADYKIDVILLPNLHTKLYVSESAAILSSMNLYSASEQKNYEIGYLFNSKKQVKDLTDYIYDQLLDPIPEFYLEGEFAEELKKPRESGIIGWIKEQFVSVNDKDVSNAAAPVASSEVQNEFEVDHNLKNGESDLGKVGYCIRCRKELPKFDPKKPYCPIHFQSWNKYKNPKYKEKFCTLCGIEHKTSIEKPLCLTCYNSYPLVGYYKK